MTVKGYLFYESIPEPIPIPADFAEEYDTIPKLLQTLNEAIAESRTDPQLDFCGYLILYNDAQ